MSKQYTVEEARQWYNNLPGKRVSAAMIIRDADHVLMIKDDYKQHWTFPSGAVDPHESPFAAAIRETKEEVGITINPANVQLQSAVYVPERNGFEDRLHFFFVTSSIASDIPVTPEPGVEAYEWVKLNEIGQRAGDRREYHGLQQMLESGATQHYFEAHDTNNN